MWNFDLWARTNDSNGWDNGTFQIWKSCWAQTTELIIWCPVTVVLPNGEISFISLHGSAPTNCFTNNYSYVQEMLGWRPEWLVRNLGWWCQNKNNLWERCIITFTSLNELNRNFISFETKILSQNELWWLLHILVILAYQFIDFWDPFCKLKNTRKRFSWCTMLPVSAGDWI